MLATGELARLCRDDYRDLGPPSWAEVVDRFRVGIDDVVGYYARGRRLVFVCRGTESPANLSNFLLEWIRNITYRPQPWAGFAPVHEGFAWNVEALYDEMRTSDVVSQWLRYGGDLALTGHSRGGALALLLATVFARQGSRARQVVTFGCPRVGGAEWRKKYHRLGLPTTRVENHLDPVPMLPPFIFFRHVGRKLIANPRLTASHDIDDYVGPITGL